jgi:hypothetical protein
MTTLAMPVLPVGPFSTVLGVVCLILAFSLMAYKRRNR